MAYTLTNIVENVTFSKFKIRHQHILTMNAVMVLKLRTRYR